MSWLDRLPAPARHALLLILLAPVAVAISVPATAILAAGGVSGVDWSAVATATLDAVMVSAAGGALAWVALVITPLTRRYGVGEPPPPVAEPIALRGGYADDAGA